MLKRIRRNVGFDAVMGLLIGFSDVTFRRNDVGKRRKATEFYSKVFRILIRIKVDLSNEFGKYAVANLKASEILPV